MVWNMKVIGKMISLMDKEKKYGIMGIYILALMKMARKVDMEGCK